MKAQTPSDSLRKKMLSKTAKKNIIINNIGKKFFFTSLFFLFILILLGYFLLLNNGGPVSVSKINQMAAIVNKVRGLESDIQKNQNEILSMVQEYREETGKDLPTVDLMKLTEEEKLILEEKIFNESNISIKNLLGEILEKKSDILELNMKIKKLEGLLPRPHIVLAGENHYQISMNYLVSIKGVEKDEALELMERALIFEPLIPGFKIWNFYSYGKYGTFVTQGSASISPNEVNRREKKKVTDARDKAISERDILANDINVLRKKRDQIIDQINNLSNEKQHLLKKVGELNKENTKMIRRINSVHFLIDTKSNLRKGGVLKGGFLRSLRLQSIAVDYYKESIDLTKNNEIEILPISFKLKSIRKVTLYPRFYKKNMDYKVEIDKNKNAALLKIMNIEKLKNERVVISVE